MPSSIECVASGQLEPGFPGLLAGKDPSQNRKVYVFSGFAADSLPVVRAEPLQPRGDDDGGLRPARAEMAVSGVALSGFVVSQPQRLG